MCDAPIRFGDYRGATIDERRKKLIFLVAGMFLVRRLAGLDRRPSPAREGALRDAVDDAVERWRGRETSRLSRTGR